MSGVLVKYGGIAINSDKSFNVQTNNKEDFVKEQSILDRSFTYQNIGNPCELYSVILDGSVSAFPDNPDTENLGYWSDSISDNDGYFSDPVVIEFVSSENISSAGITVTFDVQKEIFPTDVTIVWRNSSSILSTQNFNVNSGKFFFSNKVELYNRVTMVFRRMNMPKNKLKIQRVEFGLLTDSDTGFDLQNTKLSRSISPISSEISINTFNFSLVSRDNIEYAFQERQPIEVSFNDELHGQFFVKTAKRKSAKNYDVSCEDFFGILDTVDFTGGIYVNKNASELIQDIFDVAQIPVVISSEIDTETVTGHLEYTSCREALKQVLFAVQAVADTSGVTHVKIEKMQEDIAVQEIQQTRLMQGLNISTESRVSAVEITAHTFAPIDEIQTVYEAEKSGEGNNILVKFSEPLHDLSITKGTIIKSGENFALIIAMTGCILTGKKYQHTTATKSMQNPSLLSTDTANVKSITDATLVSSDNVDRVLRSCYNYLVKTDSIKAKIIESKHESESGYVYDEPVKIGDVVSINTEYQGKVQGRVEKQTYTLNGGILVKDTVLR